MTAGLFKLLLIAVIADVSTTLARPGPQFAQKTSDKLAAIDEILSSIWQAKCDRCGSDGFCLAGVCICDEGFMGDDCSQTYIPTDVPGGVPIILGTEDENVGTAKMWLDVNGIEKLLVGWPTRTGLSEDQAREQCQKVLVMENPFKEHCDEYFTELALKASIDNCVNDIKVVGQLNYAYVPLLFYANSCYFSIKAYDSYDSSDVELSE